MLRIRMTPVFAIGSCFWLFPAALPAESVSKAQRPNIVFVISDDQRWDTIGAAGNPAVKTPNLDRLATEGVHFIQGTVSIPQCSPLRAQLLTGLPSHQNGWYSNQTQRPDVCNANGFGQYALVPDLLRKAGYRTGLVGKWHLDPDPWNCGFEEIGLWLPPGGGAYKDLALARGKSRERKKVPGFVQEVFTDSALEFLRTAARKGDAPFFLWLAYTAPHTPLKPNPERIEKLYAGKTREELIPSGFSAKPSKNEKQWNQYYEAVSLVDEQVGRIVKTLEEERLTSNTVIVYLGDNGYMMGDRGISGKVVPYEGSIRVPFIVAAPPVAGISGATHAAASSLDLPPTFLQLAGLNPPKEWPGRSLLPVLEGRKDHGITHAIVEFPDNDNWKFGDIGYRAIRTPEYKLIDWMTPAKPDEFYDLKNDPWERRNLAQSPDAQAPREKLRRQLEDWRRVTKDDGVTTGVRRGKEND